MRAPPSTTTDAAPKEISPMNSDTHLPASWENSAAIAASASAVCAASWFGESA